MKQGGAQIKVPPENARAIPIAVNTTATASRSRFHRATRMASWRFHFSAVSRAFLLWLSLVGLSIAHPSSAKLNVTPPRLAGTSLRKVHSQLEQLSHSCGLETCILRKIGGLYGCQLAAARAGCRKYAPNDDGHYTRKRGAVRIPTVWCSITWQISLSLARS